MRISSVNQNLWLSSCIVLVHSISGICLNRCGSLPYQHIMQVKYEYASFSLSLLLISVLLPQYPKVLQQSLHPSLHSPTVFSSNKAKALYELMHFSQQPHFLPYLAFISLPSECQACRLLVSSSTTSMLNEVLLLLTKRWLWGVFPVYTSHCLSATGSSSRHRQLPETAQKQTSASEETGILWNGASNNSRN